MSTGEHTLVFYKDKSLIPEGGYCYQSGEWDGITYKLQGLCPYWSIDENLPHQENGYCKYMEKSDQDLGFGLIWDQVKECDVNWGDYPYE